MSKWRVGLDCGRYHVSEIGDQWGGGDTFATEERAVEELRRVQLRALESAERDLDIAKARVAEKRKYLAEPPRVSRMNRASPDGGEEHGS